MYSHSACQAFFARRAPGATLDFGHPACEIRKVNKATKTPRGRKQAVAPDPRPLSEQVADALAWLERHASKATRNGMARYAIPSDHALGAGMRDIQALAKTLGHNHALASALWNTGVYEARMLTAYVADPVLVTPAQMDGWAREFDNWATCDTLCFVLFDRTPHAWRKVEQWSTRRDEFVRRAAFALLASMALHHKHSDDAPFRASLAWIERAADDERNFVKKAVNWALRSIGRRNAALHGDAVALAQRLAASSAAHTRWIGKDALRELRNPKTVARLAPKQR